MDMDVVRVKHGAMEHAEQSIATEIPFTLVANEIHLVTLLCSPIDLKELTVGYLFTSGFVKNASEILSYDCDTQRWVAQVELSRSPDPKLLEERLYTSGCGKGVMYASIVEIGTRHPIETPLKISPKQVNSLAHWLQHCSSLYRETGAVHTAALSEFGEIPIYWFDDVGRHNAVDKVIGKACMEGKDLSNSILISSGRTSSEILHKAKKAGIPISISRGAPTHQTILRARDMGVTIVGFARGGQFTVYSHEERIETHDPLG